jgi:hypothetical protein
MLSKLTSNQKLVIIVSLIILFAIFVCAISITVTRKISNREEPTPAVIETLDYCNADPQTTCLLSFAKDINGLAIIQIFSPVEDTPSFYLNIIRTDDETTYLCAKSKNDPAILYCQGEVLNLGEQVEIQVISLESYETIAQGNFLIKAILVMTESISSQIELLETPVVTETEPPTITETPEIIETPPVSYP